jgi:hypothetical protein
MDYELKVTERRQLNCKMRPNGGMDAIAEARILNLTWSCQL